MRRNGLNKQAIQASEVFDDEDYTDDEIRSFIEYYSNMSLIAKQLLIVWRRCFDSFKVVVIKTNIVLIYTNIVDSIFRYVCLKYYRIINRRIFYLF